MAEQKKLTIEKEYCDTWVITDAIREIIQNAIDTRTEPLIVQNGNMWEVLDTGIGVKLSDFLLGRSAKHNDPDAIGQFGEGLKIACLVMARNGRAISVTALKKKYVFSFQYDKEWGSELLTIDITASPHAIGTVVAMECSTAEMEAAQSLFLRLSPKDVLEKVPTREEVLDAPSLVYINGLQVTKIDSMFGYNLLDKDLVNRDRSAVGYEAIKKGIASVLSNVSNQYIIQTIVRTAVDDDRSRQNAVEFSVNFAPKQLAWRRAVKELYGDKICLGIGETRIDIRAEERDYMVLHLPWALARSMDRLFPSAREVVREKRRIVPMNRLLAAERTFFQQAKDLADEIANEAFLTIYPLRVFIDKENPMETGYYSDGIAGICYETIHNQDLSGAVRTILHEYTHGTSGEADNTRSFESALCDVITSLGMKLITEKKSGMKRWTLKDLKVAQGNGS